MRHRWIVGLAAVAALLATAGERAAAAEKIKLHIVQGGGHNWKKHFPILAEVLEKTGDFEITMSADLDELKAENIAKYDAVLIYGSGNNFKSPEQEKGLCDFVRNGGAFVGVHSATDAFKRSDPYWEMVGGRFAGHGGGKFQVVILDHEHVITKPMADFEIQDETYRHRYHPESEKLLHHLIRCNRGKEQQSMAWVRPYGKGRMFYTSLGHGTPAWKNPAFQRLVVRGLYWAVGREPKDPPPAK